MPPCSLVREQLWIMWNIVCYSRLLTFFKTCLPELLKSNSSCSSNSWQHTGSFYEMPCSLSVLSVNGPLSGTTRVSQYQKGKTNLDFTEARDSEWQWHPLGHMQVCTLLQSDNHASTPPLSFLQAGCPSYCPTNSVKALKAELQTLSENESKSALYCASVPVV